MDLDDELCLCFHVTKRKVINYLRVEKPRRAGQLSECFGAGTGCGWCRAYLQRLFDQQSQGKSQGPEVEPSSSEHAQGRAAYVRSGHGTPPPGATPIDSQPASTHHQPNAEFPPSDPPRSDAPGDK
jgi:bacterioferritin-associated ferredoxin